MIVQETANEIYFSFPSEKDAKEFGIEYVKDEEPGSYFTVKPNGDTGWFRLDLFEADGYQINRK
jgi:hypothetical protein